MPDAPTARLGLVLPLGDDSPPDIPVDHRPAFEAIDRNVGIDDQGVHSSIPVATAARRGMYWWSTDRKLLYRCDGTEWRQVGEPPPTVTSLPTGADSWEGQEVLLKPASWSAPVYWHLKRIGSRWIPVGRQVSMRSYVNPGTTYAGSTSWFRPSATAGLLVPADGYYDFDLRVDIGVNDGVGRGYEMAPGRVQAGVVEPVSVIAKNTFGGIQSLPHSGPSTVLLTAGTGVSLVIRTPGWSGAPQLTMQHALMFMTPYELIAT